MLLWKAQRPLPRLAKKAQFIMNINLRDKMYGLLEIVIYLYRHKHSNSQTYKLIILKQMVEATDRSFKCLYFKKGCPFMSINGIRAEDLMHCILNERNSAGLFQYAHS